jgi:hypothetical protein
MEEDTEADTMEIVIAGVEGITAMATADLVATKMADTMATAPATEEDI